MIADFECAGKVGRHNPPVEILDVVVGVLDAKEISLSMRIVMFVRQRLGAPLSGTRVRDGALAPREIPFGFAQGRLSPG